MKIQEKRERVFLVLSGIFLSAMTMLNVIGITKFIQLGPLALAVGVLPYPLTFLCTDIVSELYGKSRANFLVFVGLLLNLFVISVVVLAEYIPSVDVLHQPPWQVLPISGETFLANGEKASGSVELFHFIYACTAGSVFASMLAYLAAQFCDVHLFHYWKKVTKGKKLWLRNNMSTLISQLVDSLMVISVTFGAVFLRGEMSFEQIMMLMGSNYLFKMVAALLDTIPFILTVKWLSSYLDIDIEKVH